MVHENDGPTFKVETAVFRRLVSQGLKTTGLTTTGQPKAFKSGLQFAVGALAVDLYAVEAVVLFEGVVVHKLLDRLARKTLHKLHDDRKHHREQPHTHV